MTIITNESAVKFRENNHLRKINNLIQRDTVFILSPEKNEEKVWSKPAPMWKLGEGY